MLNGIEAVIFDMDGSLIDSMWVWDSVDKAYLTGLGISFTQDTLIDVRKKIQGMSFVETAVYFKDRFDIKDSLDEICGCWNQMAFERYKNDVKLKPGARDFLDKIKAAGLKMGIATSNSKALVSMYLEVNSLEAYFSCVKTGDDIKKGKPAPDIYLTVAGELGVDPVKCLVFEDIVQGIQAGLNAGMRVCAVEDKHSAHEEQEKRKLAHYFIKDFRELLS